MCYIILLDKLNTCDNLSWHLTKDIDGGDADANRIEIQGKIFKFWNF